MIIRLGDSRLIKQRLVGIWDNIEKALENIVLRREQRTMISYVPRFMFIVKSFAYSDDGNIKRFASGARPNSILTDKDCHRFKLLPHYWYNYSDRIYDTPKWEFELDKRFSLEINVIRKENSEFFDYIMISRLFKKKSNFRQRLILDSLTRCCFSSKPKTANKSTIKRKTCNLLKFLYISAFLEIKIKSSD